MSDGRAVEVAEEIAIHLVRSPLPFTETGFFIDYGKFIQKADVWSAGN
jgi:hypothetical protein